MAQIKLYSKLKEDKYDTFKDAFKSCLLLTPEEIKNHKPDAFIEDMFNTLQDLKPNRDLLVSLGNIEHKNEELRLNYLKCRKVTMKATQLKYETIFRDMWNWIYHNPTKSPKDWPGWKVNGGEHYDEYTFNPACNAVDGKCTQCPVKWKGYVCFERNSELAKFERTSNIKRRKMLAKRINKFSFSMDKYFSATKYDEKQHIVEEYFLDKEN
jgi:hypothetical protein